MNTKHTPAPWRLAPHYKCGWNGIAKEPTPNRWQGIYEPVPGQEFGSRSAIVSVGIKGGEVDDCWLNISEANARLIAAAPEMLDALIAADGLLRDFGHSLPQVKAAIAKAKP